MVLSALLNVVLPVALVAFVGALAGRYLKIDQKAIARLSLYALSPALALDTLLHTTVDAGKALLVVVSYVISVAVMGLLAGGVARGFESTTRRTVTATVMIGNNGNFGLPIALFALGQAGFQYSLIVFVASVIVTFTVGPALLGQGTTLKDGLRSVLRLPLVWCVLLALALRGLNVELPLGIDRGIGLLAEATLTMVLLALGLQIGSSGWPRLTRPIVTASSLRLLAGPVVAFAVAWALGLRGVEVQALVLASAMPTAVNVFLLATELGADVPSAAGTVVVTTLASLATIALVVALMPALA